MSSARRRPIRSALLLAALAFLFSRPAEGSLEIEVGPTVGSTSPRDPAYKDRFLTPGASWGGCVHLGSDGFLGFELSAERFTKEGSRGWDGRVRALLISVWPMAEYDPIEGVGIYAGPGVVYADGSYSGTDDFGRFVEADGSSAGFGLAVGTSVDLWGPLSGRLDYRRTFMGVETDRAKIDGNESVVYPAESTDLSYGRFGLSLVVSMVGADRSVLGF